MAVLEKSRLFASPRLDSRIKSANVQNSERWIGYFVSPMFIYMAHFTVAGVYLNQFYVDVMKLGGLAGGAFLVMMPIVSKIVDAITNLLMGVVIDHTRTRQGKVRPWLLISAPLLMISALMLYLIPNMSLTGKAIWVAISNNLYYAFAFTIYNMSQSLLVPLSTRNTKQRDSLALVISMGQSMLPGSLIYLFIPIFLLPIMGGDQARWALVMGIISALILPGILLQYYFTKERVSEDESSAPAKQIDLWTQIKTCFSNRYWLIYFGIFILYWLGQNIYSSGLNFYANYVVGTYNDGSTLALLNVIGQFPMGMGVLLLWPIARKIGKRWTFFGGMLMAFLGSVLVYLNPSNFTTVLGALFFKSFGLLPSYLFASMMAEAMDYIEWKNGYRCDGFTATMSSVTVTIMTGAASTIFNSGLKVGTANGYVEPFTGTNLTEIFNTLASRGLEAQLPMESYQANANGVYTVGIQQSMQVNHWFVICIALIPAITYLLMAVVGYFNKVGELAPQMSKDIAARHKAEVEARGEVYVSPEEKAALEQAENDRIAEENRIQELKAKCEKKGLLFEEEEAKYQAKLASAKAKEAAKKEKVEAKKKK